MRRPFHWPLFLVAIVGAVTVKIAVNEERQLTETTLNAQVNYETPADVMILEPVQQISVRLRGERSQIETMRPFTVQVNVTLEEGELGVVGISEERLEVRRPGGIEVVSKSPNFISLTVEKVERRRLPVKADLRGEPSAGAVPGTPVVIPPDILVEGPESRVRALDVLVVAVGLEGHAITFDETVAVQAPDPLVKILEGRQVVVHIPMTVPGSEILMDELDETDEGTPDPSVSMEKP